MNTPNTSTTSTETPKTDVSDDCDVECYAERLQEESADPEQDIQLGDFVLADGPAEQDLMWHLHPHFPLIQLVIAVIATAAFVYLLKRAIRKVGETHPRR